MRVVVRPVVLSLVVSAWAVAAFAQASGSPPPLDSPRFRKGDWQKALGRTLAVQTVEVDESRNGSRTFFMSGELTPAMAPKSPDGAVRAFVESIAPMLGIADPGRDLVQRKSAVDEHQRTHVLFEQTYRGIPIRDAELAVHVEAGGKVYAAGGSVPVKTTGWEEQVRQRLQKAAVTEENARAAAESDAKARSARADGIARATARKQLIAAEPYVVWEVDVILLRGKGRWVYDIDGVTGAIVSVRSGIQTSEAAPGTEVPSPRHPPRTPGHPASAARFNRATAIPVADIPPAAGKSAAKAPPVAADATSNLFTEGFEGIWPAGSWAVYDDTNAGAYWNDTNFRAFTGSWSGGCAAGGPNAASPGGAYRNDMDTWAIAGPFSLSNATAGSFSFRYYLSSEQDFDYLHYYVSVDGQYFYGNRISGSSGGWTSASIDFTNVPGLGNITRSPNVWIAVRFTSDGSITGEGAYVDDLLVQKQTSDTPELSLDYVDAVDGTYQPGQSITIDNETTNIGAQTSGGYSIAFYASTNNIISTGDTFLGSFNRSGLAPGATASFSSTVGLPGNLAMGAYYIGAIITYADTLSSNNTNYDPWTILLSNETDGPKIGTGLGVLGNAQNHLDTYFDSPSGRGFLMRDVSRRANNNPHGHNGQMGSTSVIETGFEDEFGGFTMDDPDNVWNSATFDAAGVDAHAYTARTYDYLRGQLALNGINGAGASMFTLVDVYAPGICPDNAFWDGSIIAVCEGGSLLPLSGALDVIAHEWGHAVTELTPAGRTGGLTYEKQSGALNEAFSDWMGAAVEFSAGENNWTCGEGIGIFRNMQNPKQFNDPDTYLGQYWVNTDSCTPTGGNDNCGVHTNSGVGNKMFYLLSVGSGSESGGVFNGVAVSGLGVNTAMAIALSANRYYWPANATYAVARQGMITAAGPYGQNAVNQVMNAWAAVGVGSPVQTCTSFTINPTSVSRTSASGSQLVTITGAPAGCAGGNWTASGNGSWLTVSPTSGSGSGSATASWTATSVQRSGNASIAGQTFTVTQSAPGTGGARHGDFTGDGRSEVLWRSAAGAFAMWELNGRSILNGNVFATITDMNWKVLGFGDFNDDGYEDIFYRRAGTGDTAVWLLQGRNFLSTAAGPVIADMNWQMHAIGDFNGDGRDELIWRHATTGDVAMWEMNGTSVTNGAVFYRVADLNWQIVLAADFDGDGKDELLWRHATTGDIAMWDLQGRTLLNGAIFYRLSDPQWQIIAVGDYNGDGKKDLLWHHPPSGMIAMWEMNHRTIVNGNAMFSVPAVWQAQISGDYTGDGKDEVLWRNVQTGEVAMWELNGHSLINGSTFYTVSDLGWKMQPRGGVRPALESQ